MDIKTKIKDMLDNPVSFFFIANAMAMYAEAVIKEGGGLPPRHIIDNECYLHVAKDVKAMLNAK